MRAAPHRPANQAVHFLGPEGTFSHVLALARFGGRAPLVAEPDFESVVEKVVAGNGALGLLPVENSSGGTVYDSIDLLIRNRAGISVIEELALDVRIALLRSPAAASPPKTVYSHFTQVKHHADWLRAKYPGVKLVPVASTALAARKAAANPSAAALASPGAARLYGLRVAARPPSKSHNVTHFYVLSPAPRPLAGGGSPTRTALVAALPNTCGSLHAFLAPFARHGVSLTSIVSRPVPGKPQTYIFFLEIEGDPSHPGVAAALARARRLSESLDPLGSFPTGKRFRS